MGGYLSSWNKSDPAATGMALEKAKEIVSNDPVVVFSKSYCPYCTRVKKLLRQLGASYKVVELDAESDGSHIQSALAEWTGQRTVPNVFIGGNHIGGCDTVTEIHRGGKLVPLLSQAGALAGPAA
ncbi:unnamed protein product [Spirodela intermedia]|uniref:Glutaredoxin domain-containing protein n=2 Tax=Spirodela intermedia TaxID=51605 RepID=A0A7I8J614_SPIIN|nr:unnamed protein product [Spirodela intermedia]CAA6665531.1 unnamed protein product [Spirodela intermedia]CAA7402265.1 unnamed protein product [Spirodela intermedia]